MASRSDAKGYFWCQYETSSGKRQYVALWDEDVLANVSLCGRCLWSIATESQFTNNNSNIDKNFLTMCCQHKTNNWKSHLEFLYKSGLSVFEMLYISVFSFRFHSTEQPLTYQLLVVHNLSFIIQLKGKITLYTPLGLFFSLQAEQTCCCRCTTLIFFFFLISMGKWLHTDDGATAWFWCLIQGHLGIWLGGTGTETTNPGIHVHLLYQLSLLLALLLPSYVMSNLDYTCRVIRLVSAREITFSWTYNSYWGAFCTFSTIENKYCHVFRILVSTWYWSNSSCDTPNSYLYKLHQKHTWE